MFVVFSVGDILFGDRAELWEHGTFLVLCLVTYDLWFRTDSLLLDLSKKEAARRVAKPIGICFRLPKYPLWVLEASQPVG